MKKDTSKNRTIIRYRRLLIYTFLIVMLLMYASARIQIKKETEAHAGVKTETDAHKNTKDTKDTEITEAESVAESTEGLLKSKGTIQSEDSTDNKIKKNKIKDHSKDTGFRIEEEDMWSLYLTNEDYPVPKDYKMTKVNIPDTQQFIDSRVLEPLQQMLDAARKEGLRPIVCSGYRTLKKQKILFNNKVQSFLEQGKTEKESARLAKRVISVPGSGEHCMGLAVDIYSYDYRELEEGFADTAEGKWLREHCAEYGFILRYDKGKEEITGIDYEPWHFRYVGVKTAGYLTEKGICLEEFYIEESLFG